MATVLVVGASGILAPAVGDLVARGDDVVAVARSVDALRALRERHDEDPGRIEFLASDATDPSFPAVLETYLADVAMTLSSAIVYRPAASADVLDRVTESLSGPVVEILTSDTAAPVNDDEQWSLGALPPGRPNRSRVVLGWNADLGAARWHDAAAVSAAAVAALDDPRDQILGTVSPWSDRPSG